MSKTITKQIFIILLTCIAIMLVAALIFYQYIPSNKIVPAKVQAYQTPDSIQAEIEDSTNQELMQQNELYEITDSNLEQYKSNKSYNPGKSDPFSEYSEESNPASTKSKSSGSSSQEGDDTNKNNESGKSDKGGSKTDQNTTDNYYTASNISKGTK